MDYSQLSEQEKIEMFNLRKADHPISRHTFKVEIRPGVIRYNTIEVGKKYRINRPGLKAAHNREVQIIDFAYKKKEGGKDAVYDDAIPLGVVVKFTDRNVKGSYYDMLDLIEVN